MPGWLKQSTTTTIKLGPFVDKADGVTAKTALTPTVKLSKNGGTLAARNDATAITHDADGYYTVSLNATDTNTLGRLRAAVTDATQHLPVWDDFLVLPANVYDSLVAGSDLLDIQVGTADYEAIAKKVLGLDFATAAADAAARSLLNAARPAVNGFTTADTTISVYDENGAESHSFTATPALNTDPIGTLTRN